MPRCHCLVFTHHAGTGNKKKKPFFFFNKYSFHYFDLFSIAVLSSYLVVLYRDCTFRKGSASCSHRKSPRTPGTARYGRSLRQLLLFRSACTPHTEDAPSSMSGLILSIWSCGITHLNSAGYTYHHIYLSSAASPMQVSFSIALCCASVPSDVSSGAPGCSPCS